MSNKNIEVDNNIQHIAYLYFNEHKTSSEIAKIYNGVNAITIRRALQRHGYTLRNENYNRIYNLDSECFDCIDSPNKAWAIGFIASDGHISKNMNLIFSQNISQKDGLEHLRKICKTNIPIKIKNKSYVHISICCKHICQTLLSMGLTHNKSQYYDFDKLVSCIPQEFINDFLRGLFDGDGSICYYKYPYFKKHSVHVGFTHTLPAIKYWEKYFNTSTKLTKENDFVYTWKTSNRFLAEKIYHTLYDGAECYLSCKKNKFEEFLQIFHEEENKKSQINKERPSTIIISAPKAKFAMAKV